MGSSFLILLREGLEAALIVAIVLAYLKRLERDADFRTVWLGTAAGVGIALAAGIVIFAVVGELEGKAEEITEGIIAFVAAGVLTWMIFGMAFLGFLQVTALVLNMLPVPGLDGYSVPEPHLSPQTQRTLEPVKQWGLIVLIVLLFTPMLNRWFFEVVFWFVELFGVPAGLSIAGMDLVRFWSAWF